MKFIVFVLILVLSVAVVLFLIGRYPVALVGRSPVWFKTWEKAENAVKNSHNVETSSSLLGKSMIDFDDLKNIELLKEVERGTLSVLIDDMIIYQEGKKEIVDLEDLAMDKINKALQGGNIEQAAKFVYNLSFEDFKELVLLPQARREILREEFVKREKNFDEWFFEAKRSKRVRLFLVPFSWDGKSVR